jgi:hypothetical protein
MHSNADMAKQTNGRAILHPWLGLTSQPSFCILEPLKMGPIDCPETMVRNYRYSLRNDPGEHTSHLLRSGNLKSRTHSMFRAYKHSQHYYITNYLHNSHL